MQRNIKEWILFIVFIVIFAAMSVLSPDKFLSAGNLQSMAFQLPEFGILSLAMMAVIVTGGINLSLITTTALSGITMALVLSGMNAAGANVALTIVTAIVAGFAVAMACGAVNGFFVSIVGVSPILVTLGTQTLFEGISMNVTKGGAISGFPDAYFFFGNESVLGIPMPMLIFVLVIVAVILLLEKSPWGMQVYMAGCNATATEYSGINVKMVIFKVYILSASLSFLAAVVMTSRYNSAKVDYGSSYLLQSVAASVLGGTDISGGYGKVIGTVIAVCTLQVLSSGLNILGMNRFFIDIIMGFILLLVLSINFINAKIKEKNYFPVNKLLKKNA